MPFPFVRLGVIFTLRHPVDRSLMRANIPQKIGLGAAAVLAVAITLAPSAAQADPSGCSIGVSGSTSSTGLLSATGTGSCNQIASRTLRVEIKQAIPGQPDPLVNANVDSRAGLSYRATVSSCDHGRVSYYYGRAFFTTNTTYHDTDPTGQHTC